MVGGLSLINSNIYLQYCLRSSCDGVLEGLRNLSDDFMISVHASHLDISGYILLV
jgi:hypothetical protein